MATPAIAVTAPAEGLTELEARRRLRARPRSSAKKSSRSYASIVRANVFTIFNLILLVARRLDARVRRVAGRALPRVLVANSGDRDRAGGTREARARPARGARGADRDRRPRRRAPTRRTSTRRRRRRPRRAPAGRPGRRGRRARRGERPGARRVDPDGRVAAGGAERRRDEVRSGSFAVEGDRRVRGDRGRRGQLRDADHRRGARVPPSALAARARDQPAAARARRDHRAARAAARRRALGAPHAAAHAVPTSVAAVVTLVPEGPDPAREPHLRGRRAAHGAPRRARAAAERGRVARLRRRRLPRQDRNAHRAEAARARARPGGRRRRGAPRVAARPLRRVRRQRTRRSRRSRSAFPAGPRAAEQLVPFSSRRRFGALALDGDSSSSARRSCSRSARSRQRVDEEARSGRRVVAFGRAPADPTRTRTRAAGGSSRSGSSCSPSSCARRRTETVEFFRAQGVELKVLSGDRPETVARDRGRRGHRGRRSRRCDGRRGLDCAAGARGVGDRPHLAGGKARVGRGAARREAATWRWSATA